MCTYSERANLPIEQSLQQNRFNNIGPQTNVITPKTTERERGMFSIKCVRERERKRGRDFLY